MGVYGPSVFFLLENGVDIQPKALDPELSRGHPMLYVFANAVVAKFFGSSISVLHAFNLFLACTVLWATFALGKKVFDATTGVIGAVLLVSQPIFQAQATLILPEMALALTAIGMLYGYLAKMPVLYLVSGIAAVWLKETAIFIPLILITHFLWGLHQKRLSLLQADALLKIFWLGIPWMAFGAFLWIQKAQNGWFLFPYHTSLFDFDPAELLKKLVRFLLFLFYDQGRFLWGLILLLSLLGAFLRKKLVWSNLVEDTHWPVLSCFFLYSLVLLAFSSTNAYLNRYLLLLFPPLSLVVAYGLKVTFSYAWNNWTGSWHYVVLPASLVLSFSLIALPWLLPTDDFVYDEHPVFKRHIALMEMAVQEVMNREEYDGCHIQCNWPIHTAFEDEQAGYRKDPLNFYLLGPSDTLDFKVWLMPGSIANPPSPQQTSIYQVIEHAGMTCTIYQCR
jgi:4-amino-4-deoxy-L-arabinose transferase-like glycosyltransferase